MATYESVDVDDSGNGGTGALTMLARILMTAYEGLESLIDNAKRDYNTLPITAVIATAIVVLLFSLARTKWT